MSDGAADTCCRCCSSFILTSGLTALFLWLSLRTSAPKCYLQNISIPSLNRSDPNPPRANSSDGGAVLSFDLRLVNTNKDKGVYYDAVKVSFSSIDGGGNKSRNPLGNFTVPAFYQGHQKKATKSGSLNGTDITAGAAILLRRGNGSSATTGSFRVDIATRVRYKIIFFKTKRHRIEVGAEFGVNDQGTKVSPKDVRLKSGGHRIGGGGELTKATTSFCWGIGVLLFSVLVS